MLKYLNRLLATGFFVGHIPGAPGTYGSLLALGLLYFFPILSTLPLLTIILIIGVLTSGLAERINAQKDDPRIVIDEIFGMLLVFWNHPQGIGWLVTGFILFRLFDIAKPLGIKKMQEIPGGWGVMIDDLLAGLISWSIIRLILIIANGG